MLNEKKRKSPSKREKGGVDEFGLNIKQRAFADYYLIDQNASAAYVKAGYTAKNENVAAANASALIRTHKVAAYIEQRRKKVLDKLEISQERVLAEVARLAYFDLSKCYGPDGKILPLAEMDEDTRRAIASIELDAGVVTKLRGHDKHSALDKLMRFLQLYKEVQVPPGGMNIGPPPPGSKMEVTVKVSPDEAYRRMLTPS